MRRRHESGLPRSRCVVLAAAGAAVAQTPSVVNGTLDVRPLTGALDRELDALVAQHDRSDVGRLRRRDEPAR